MKGTFMSKCPNCGNELNNDEKFCPKCGYFLDKHEDTNKQNCCPFCGKEIKGNESYCPHCGANLKDAGYTNPATKQDTNNNSNKIQTPNNDSNKSLKGELTGIFITIFIGIIGLILCLCLGDEKCKKAAIITFVIRAALYFLIRLTFLLN